MLNLFYKLFYLTNKINNNILKRILGLLIRTIANITVSFWYKVTFTFQKPLNKSNTIPVIVSLTSFPKRLPKLWIVIESILRQTDRPEKIILYLSREQVPSFECLPKSLQKLQTKGLEIKLCEGDLRSHKKYYYSFQEYPNSLIVTLDDDIIYPKNTLSELYNTYLKHPKTIISRYSHYIHIENGKVQPYSKWKRKKNTENPNYLNFFGSGGGTLFPVQYISKDILNKEVFMKICKFADDIWLNAYTRHSKLKVYVINNKSCEILNVQINNDERLMDTNVTQNLNDVQLENVSNYFISTYGYDPFLLK